MTKPHALPPSSPWGTLTELLLAFAVHRHGTAAWDSIASELQKRTSDPSLSLTPQNCRLKYLDLKRRFLAPNHDFLHDKSDAEVAAPLLDELRKLRVAELRREVQRYDLNIESLELKVKKMEEERERSQREESESADLEKKSVGNTRAEPAAAGESVTGDELAKDQLSANESNSTDLGAAKLKTGERDPEPAPTSDDDVRLNGTGQVSEKPIEVKSEPDRRSVRADSWNGSSNSSIQAKREPESNSAGLIEPGAESDGGVGVENSDMQSSASRSRKGERIDKLRRECEGEGEGEDQSRAVKSMSAESQPLVDFLHSIRAHKLGSIFERRLRSQETSKYQKLVLQHVDLETIETRLKEGWYYGSSTKFFRDLLLLVNNALIFFGRKSPEANAATEIRQLISKEITQKTAKSIFSSRKQVSLQSLSMSKKEETKPSDSLALKPRISGSLIVCRKRSSIAAKASGSDKKKEQGSAPAEEKDTKKHSEQSGNSEEPKITKKRTRDRLFSSTPTSGKKNSKNQSNDNSKNSFAESRKQHGKGGSSSSSQPAEPKNDNKKNQSASDSKKRGAANFLNRMKQGSSSNNGALLDALKNRPLTSESTSSKGGSELKKNENTKRGEKKEVATKKNAETSQAKEKEKEKVSPGKRNVGRPPKRGAAPPSALGKRGREKADIETPPPKQPKKRTRKL